MTYTYIIHFRHTSYNQCRTYPQNYNRHSNSLFVEADQNLENAILAVKTVGGTNIKVYEAMSGRRIM